MNKQLIKIIKRTDSEAKAPSPVKKPKKKRSIEGPIQTWITDRRETFDTEDRTLSSQFAVLSADPVS